MKQISEQSCVGKGSFKMPAHLSSPPGVRSVGQQLFEDMKSQQTEVGFVFQIATARVKNGLRSEIPFRKQIRIAKNAVSSPCSPTRFWLCFFTSSEREKSPPIQPKNHEYFPSLAIIINRLHKLPLLSPALLPIFPSHARRQNSTPPRFPP